MVVAYNQPGRRPSLYGRSAGRVELTLQDPDLIIRSTRFPDTARIYHNWFDHTVVGSKWLLAAVNFPADGSAFVLSAYVNRRILRGEELWRKEQR